MSNRNNIKVHAKGFVALDTFEILPRLATWHYRGAMGYELHLLIGWLVFHFEIGFEHYDTQS